ncbi:MAG: hypothetical protein RMJ98_03610 [Myxococcales bacterium]|nr:hypothetical protein [Polyangiaceae bacterium]MDW8248375.1 hypothetical protein [Myxococcales bacterium]
MTLWHALAVAGGWVLSACTSGTVWRPGTSEQPHVLTERQRTPSQASADPWPPMTSVSSFPTVDDRHLPSAGHNPPYWSGQVRVNGVLWPLYPRMSPEIVVPEGAIALEFHHDLSGNAQLIYAMEKRAAGFDPGGGDWEYLVLNPEGVVETRGILPFCARCHAEAPHDHLFGPRLSAKRHILQSSTPEEPPTEVEEDSAAAPNEDTAPSTGSKRPDRPRKKRK